MTKHDIGKLVPADDRLVKICCRWTHEQPVVEPQAAQTRQVPERFIVKDWQDGQASPVYPAAIEAWRWSAREGSWGLLGFEDTLRCWN